MAWFPGLASLGLSAEAWEALAKQGSLCADRCQTGSPCKLRFRLRGRQQSRYVGTSPGFVAQIRQELTQLQAETRSRKRLRPLLREARQCLQRTKRQLQPLLSLSGRVFHGRAIRRRRRGDTCVDVVE
jgi:hypothetical protein